MPRVSTDHLTARREQILAAARACFLRNGLHNTSMQDLIREADLSVGAVYRYFKSKNEIINAIAENVAGGIAARLEEVAEQQPPMSIAAAMDVILDLVDEQLGPDGNFPLALQIWAEATLDPAIGAIVHDRYVALRRPFVSLVRNAVRRGEMPADTDAEAVGMALFGTLPGYALQRLLVGSPDKAAYMAGLRALLGGR